MKTAISFFVFLLLVFSIPIESQAEEIYLMVTPTQEKEKVSSIEYIKKSLKNGGYIKINADTCFNIDANTMKEAITTDEGGTYFTNISILNFIGRNGWKLHTYTLNLYIFSKSTGVF